MPTFEYFCDACDAEFEELLLKKDDVEQYFDHHPCPNCTGRAERVRVSSFAFKFAGNVNQGAGTGVHGNSGVHDLDYPVVDKAVGRSAEEKWKVYNQRKDDRDKARREFGTNAVSQDGDKIAPLADGAVRDRGKAMTLLEKAKKSTPSSE